MTNNTKLITNHILSEYIVTHIDELKDKVIEITDMNELNRYNSKALYHKYLQNSFAGYELTSPDNKVRMIVSEIHDKNGFKKGYKVETVEKLLNYQRQLHYDLKPKFYGNLIPMQEGDLTVIDYIRENKLPQNDSIMVHDKELKTKFEKVDKKKYVPKNNPNAYIIVDSYAGFGGVDIHVIKKAVENLCISTLVYDGRKLNSDKDKIVVSKTYMDTINLP